VKSHLVLTEPGYPGDEPWKSSGYKADVRALKARLQPVLDRIQERRAREAAEREAQEGKR
jgi:hypothetical protein